MVTGDGVGGVPVGFAVAVMSRAVAVVMGSPILCRGYRFRDGMRHEATCCVLDFAEWRKFGKFSVPIDQTCQSGRVESAKFHLPVGKRR